MKATAAELSSLKRFKGPRISGAVTPQTLVPGALPLGTLSGRMCRSFS